MTNSGIENDCVESVEDRMGYPGAHEAGIHAGWDAGLSQSSRSCRRMLVHTPRQAAYLGTRNSPFKKKRIQLKLLD